MLEMVLKNRIKEVLTEQEMTPYRLAVSMGKHPNHIYSLVKQDTIPDNTRLKTLVDIAGILGVTVDRLFEVKPD